MSVTLVSLNRSFDRSVLPYYNVLMLDITVLRAIPPMEELLNAPWALTFEGLLGRDAVKKILVEVVTCFRSELRSDSGERPEVGEVPGLIAERAVGLLARKASSSLKAVVNASGVVIHTNLGRSPLAKDAVEAVAGIAGSYSTLEYSPEKGARSGRNGHVEWLVCRITGAEAALVVNNNAAAVLLALSGLASGREVVVSNGELVEIGDSFRIPDILSFSGARMVAVGCTNSTRIADYRNAITENTAVLLKVHPSNFRIQGFVTDTGRRELAELALERGLIFLEDLGSGLLHDLGRTFSDIEHSVRDCLQAGSLLTFSGDKLLGGPQIGVIAGARPLVDRLRSHQLLRALRVDKMTLAAFEATLRLYLTGRQQEIPVIRMIQAGPAALKKQAERLCRTLRSVVKDAAGAAEWTVEVIPVEDAIGGGSFPTERLSGFGIAIRAGSGFDAGRLAAAFRASPVPVIPAVRDDRTILHVRTLLDGDERTIAAAFAGILEKQV